MEPRSASAEKSDLLTSGDGVWAPESSGVQIGALHRAVDLSSLSRKGVAGASKGVCSALKDDQSILRMSPTELTLTPNTTMACPAHDISDLPASKEMSISYEPASDLDTSYSASPHKTPPASPSYSSTATPVSFNFSPIGSPSSQTTHASFEIKTGIAIPRPPRSDLPHDRYRLHFTDDTGPLSWPTSAASSSRVASSFPYHDTQPVDLKGKGKAKETRPPSPELGLADVEHGPFPPNTRLATGDQVEQGAGTHNLRNLDEANTSQPSSLDSFLGVTRRKSHIGLSFSEQRFTPSAAPGHTRRQTSFSAGRRRSRSSHSHRRSPTPVPRTSRESRSRERVTLPRRKGKALHRLLSIAKRGRSSRQTRRSPEGNVSGLAQPTHSIVSPTPDSREHLNLSIEGAIQPLDPSLPPSPLVLPATRISARIHPSISGNDEEVSVGDDVDSDSGETSTSGSTTVRWSATPRARNFDPGDAGPEDLDLEPSSVTVITTAPEAPRHSILIAAPAASNPSEPIPGPLAPSSSVTPATRPPKLKFVGRANTSPSIPQVVVSSTVASGSSSAPFASNYYIPSTAFEYRHHSNSVLTSASGPEHSIAYTYIHTLPPLANRPIPQPDGCGQVPAEFTPLSPTFTSTIPSVFSSPVQTKIRPLDYFSLIIPYELQLEVFRAVFQLHVVDHEGFVQSPAWSFGAATGGFWQSASGKKPRFDAARWVGFEQGVREVVRIGRVSRRWHMLSLDGQLWATTSFSGFPNVPAEFLIRITRSIGPFLKSLDLRGVLGLTPSVIISVVDNIRSLKDDYHVTESQQAEADADAERDPQLAKIAAALHEIPTPPKTQLTVIKLDGCSSIPIRPLHTLLGGSPLLEVLSLRGIPSVTNWTCELIGLHCSSRLVKLDLSRCANISANGIEDMIGVTKDVASSKSFSVTARPRYPIPARRFPRVKELRLAGLKRISGQTMFFIAWGLPDLEVLDISGARTLSDDDLEVFVRWDDRFDDGQVLRGQLPSSSRSAVSALRDIEPYQQLTLTSREMGLNPMSTDKYRRRLTKLRHISVSCCPLLTDAGPGHLAHSVPRLEFFEMGGVGPGVRDIGLLRLFRTTNWIRRIDLEDASEITDDIIYALIPPPPPPLSDQRRHDVDLASGRQRALPPPREPNIGELLEHIILSYAGNISDVAFLAMIAGCTKLKVMEVDNTRASDQVVKEFAKACRRRQMQGAEVVAVDCRNITRTVFNEGTGAHGPYLARNRRGFRAWEAKNLAYYDERDRKDVLSGLDVVSGRDTVGDECDESRVVLKTFHSWQAVDHMVSARQKRQKALAKRAAEPGGNESSASSSVGEGGRTSRWLQWRNQAPVGGIDFDGGDRGCVIM